MARLHSQGHRWLVTLVARMADSDRATNGNGQFCMRRSPVPVEDQSRRDSPAPTGQMHGSRLMHEFRGYSERGSFRSNSSTKSSEDRRTIAGFGDVQAPIRGAEAACVLPD